MDVTFPELSSFGTLLGFATALEQVLAELAGQAAARGECAQWAAALRQCAKTHDKRKNQLERFRRERLNEVVLQRVSGMAAGDYTPPSELPAGDGPQVLAALAAIEETAARFYDDAGKVAKNVLGGLERTFTKLAKQSRDQATALRQAS